MKKYSPIIVGLIITLYFVVLVGGAIIGQAIKDRIIRESAKQPETKNVIEVEMDKSCYDQFKNNMDKTIFVKLYFKQ